jgi:metal-responsive CopG/Arc/MetJ family transcriptional regulator
MKTIAITIDEVILARLDHLARSGGHRNRSLIVREAVAAYVVQLERAAEEEREARIIRRHRSRLARQARAAIREQAQP